MLPDDLTGLSDRLTVQVAAARRAVAEVLGTLSVAVCITRTWSTPTPSASAQIARILVEPLPHLRAAVVQLRSPRRTRGQGRPLD